MKCRERHVVYLTDRALEILDGGAGQNDTFVFPSTVGRDAPIQSLVLPDLPNFKKELSRKLSRRLDRLVQARLGFFPKCHDTSSMRGSGPA